MDEETREYVEQCFRSWWAGNQPVGCDETELKMIREVAWDSWMDGFDQGCKY